MSNGENTQDAATGEHVVVQRQAQVAVPKWMAGVAGTLLAGGLVTGGGWVMKTWNAPERIAAMESELEELKKAKAEDQLQAQKDLSQIKTDMALAQKDLSQIKADMSYLKNRWVQ